MRHVVFSLPGTLFLLNRLVSRLFQFSISLLFERRLERPQSSAVRDSSDSEMIGSGRFEMWGWATLIASGKILGCRTLYCSVSLHDVATGIRQLPHTGALSFVSGLAT